MTMRSWLALLCVAAAVLPGCAGGKGASPAAAPVAPASKLRVLRESFASPRMFHRASSLAAVSKSRPIALVRPDAALASDRSIDSVWISDAHPSGAHSIVLVWRSGVVETIERWRCNCQAGPSLRDMGRRRPFRFLMLRGAPAMTDASLPGQRRQTMIGLIPPAEARYGRPATVETIRDGYNVTLWQYGAHTQRELLAAARTLPVAHPAFAVRGYDAGGAALGTWRGPHGIDIAPQGGARFGIGVALRNISGRPLTITAIRTIPGFIQLIGIHFHRYTPPVGSAAGPPIARRPYDATSRSLHERIEPKAWVGVQVDFEVRNPCIGWSQGVYDRTVEVSYTEAGRGKSIQEVAMVPLHIHSDKSC
jgi:hypothetical protein